MNFYIEFFDKLLTMDEINNLEIEGLGSKGEGVGRLGGYAVFIEGALPGEIVNAEFLEKRKTYARAQVKEIVKKSDDRVVAPCPIYGKCGGCQLMHLSYEGQLRAKRQKVVDALRRIGKVDVKVEECVPSPSKLNYRNKIQLPVRNGKIGLYARESHDLVEMEGCLIHCPMGESVLKKIMPVVKRFKGELRHLLIKSGKDEVLVIVVTNKRPDVELRKLAKEMMACANEIKGVVHNFNTNEHNVILGDEYQVLEGSGSIREQIGDLVFNVSPASFFQVNPKQAENLYLAAIEKAELKGNETVLDAFCGVGTISLFFAQKTKKVVGVEYVPEAIEDARKNAALNGIRNVEFFCDDAAKFKGGDFDVVILNPPRKGCSPEILENLNAEKIVYISCDPATLARDLGLLKGYEITHVQPFDMFPQTAHVETLVTLLRIPSNPS